jgi:hypothetical protein
VTAYGLGYTTMIRVMIEGGISLLAAEPSLSVGTSETHIQWLPGAHFPGHNQPGFETDCTLLGVFISGIFNDATNNSDYNIERLDHSE